MNQVVVAVCIIFCVGLLIWLVNRPREGARPGRAPTASPQVVHFPGDGDYELEVVGESHYQDAIGEICGGKCADGHEHSCIAELVRDPGNAYDSNAVKVLIAGRQVGHLPREFAAYYAGALERRGLTDLRVTCDAMIIGGWRREKSGGRVDEGHFGVVLDLLDEDDA